MRKTTYHIAVVFAGLGVLLSLGCGDSTRAVGPAPTGEPAAGTTGKIVITATSEGVPLGSGDYEISVDQKYFGRMAPNTTVTIARQPVGRHAVALSVIARNCRVTSDNPQPVDVIADQASTPVIFSVSCEPGDGCPGCWDY